MGLQPMERSLIVASNACEPLKLSTALSRKCFFLISHGKRKAGSRVLPMPMVVHPCREAIRSPASMVLAPTYLRFVTSPAHIKS